MIIDLIRVHVYFTGKVQGVYFRASTMKKANELGLTGWVRNLRDGRVEAVIEGSEVKVERLIDWCKHSMPLASVVSVKMEREKSRGMEEFEIRE